MKDEHFYSSFTRVFQRNWLKIGRYVPGYLLRKRRLALFNFASVNNNNNNNNNIHFYSANSTMQFSNALYNTLWGTLPDCSTQFTIFMRKCSMIYRCPQVRISDKPSHRGHRPLLFPNSAWVL